MKDYTNWHKQKTNIENQSNEKLFREREVWWCSLGQNIGHEEDGKNNTFERPVLVLKKFNKSIFICIPLTSKTKDDKFHCVLKLKLKGNRKKEIYIILSQVRLLSSKRLIRKIVRIQKTQFSLVQSKLFKLLSLSDN